MVGPTSQPQRGMKPKKKKKKKKKAKKKKDRESSSSSSGSTSSSEELGDTKSKFSQLADDKPGKLFLGGYREMMRLLNERVGASAPADGSVELHPIFVRYYHLVVDKAKIGPRNDREILTLFTVMDALMAGNVPRALDTLMQRTKSIEAATSDALPWVVASHLELVDQSRPSTLSRREREIAIREQMREQKVDALMMKQRSTKLNTSAPSRVRDRSRSPVNTAPTGDSPRPLQEGESPRKVTFNEALNTKSGGDFRPSALATKKQSWWDRRDRGRGQQNTQKKK